MPSDGCFSTTNVCLGNISLHALNRWQKRGRIACRRKQNQGNNLMENIWFSDRVEAKPFRPALGPRRKYWIVAVHLSHLQEASPPLVECPTAPRPLWLCFICALLCYGYQHLCLHGTILRWFISDRFLFFHESQINFSERFRLVR